MDAENSVTKQLIAAGEMLRPSVGWGHLGARWITEGGAVGVCPEDVDGMCLRQALDFKHVVMCFTHYVLLHILSRIDNISYNTALLYIFIKYLE